MAEFGRDSRELPHREETDAGSGVHASTPGLHQPGAIVFTAGTTDQAQMLDRAGDENVERITRNVLARLSWRALQTPAGRAGRAA